MKIFTRSSLFVALAFVAFFGINKKSKACIDYATTVFVTCHYDTTNFTDVAIRVSNLRLFGGNPNDFCSCAITNWTNIFTNIHYVAFVDSSTNNAVAGFDVWTPDANASNAWESVLATGSWNGFVSGVNTNGLNSGNPVELIIRASLPGGYTFALLDSNLVLTQLGTDEWDSTNQTLANTHQQILNFTNPTTYVAEYDSTYFTLLDNAIFTNIDQAMEERAFDLYPVPAVDMLFVRLNEANLVESDIEVYSSTGAKVAKLSASGLATIDVSDYPAGVYFVRVSTESGVQTKKFVKTN